MNTDTVGGYRLVRKLGEGPRAEVYLGYPGSDSTDSSPVALKIFRASTPSGSILSEAEALARASGAHVIRLLDVAGAGDGGVPALVMQRVSGSSLARLLRERSRVMPGEAITMLAPLAAALSRLHRAGVGHGGMRADAVHFDDEGAPVLACFGQARLFGTQLPDALLESEDAVAVDLQQFGDLARGVLTLVRSREASALAEWVTEPSRAANWLDAVSDRLFDLGVPAPIDFAPEAHISASLPARTAGGEPLIEHSPSGLLTVLAAPDWVAPVVERARAALGSVRPRVWIGAGAVAAALVAALVLVPGSGSGSDATAEPSATPEPAASRSLDTGPITGDDPIAALVALLDARDRCIRDLSVLCLDDVDQADSAALADDQQLVQSLQQGTGSAESLTVTADQLVLQERLGDSALVALGADSKPASILLMQGEAGWRIRDYVP